jgi:aminoglycoside 3-N-acetyltransferase I
LLRKLTPSDLAAFRDLQRLFASEFEDPVSYSSSPPSDAYVQRWLAAPSSIALVALARSRVVGGLVAYVLEKFEQERTEVYVYDLAVAAMERRRGIATALLRRLQVIARELGAWVIFVQADHGDEPAIRLYESLGTREEVLHFDLPVRGPEGV